jgi:hypothetical protein
MARIKSDTATAVLSVASRGSPDQLRIKQDGNRMSSPRLLEAARRADELCRLDEERAAKLKAARDAAVPAPDDAV